MTTTEFLSHIRDLGVNLWVEGDDLCYSAPKGVLKQSLRTELVERKAELLAFLHAAHLNADFDVSPSWTDEVGSEPGEAFVAPRTPTEETLARIWARILNVEQVGIHNNFFDLGGDSLLGLQVISQASQAGLHLVPQQILQHQTIAELAAVEGTVSVQAEQGLVIGSVPLMPSQQKFFALDPPAPHHWNIATMLKVRQALDPVSLEQAGQHVLMHHDALRLRFVREGSTWRQFIAEPNGATPFTRIDLSALSQAEQGPAIEAATAELQTSLNLSTGPLMRVVLFELGAPQSGRLVVIVNHLVCDGHSWAILLEDLFAAYCQLCQGEAVRLPPKTTSFAQWVERLAGYAQTTAIQQELAYWLGLPWSKTVRLPVDCPGGMLTEASAHAVYTSLGVQEASVLLQEILEIEQVAVTDVLLTALAIALAQWTGACACIVEVADSGRWTILDDVDLSRTVGWLSIAFPVVLDLEGVNTPRDALHAVREQLGSIPDRGSSYELLCYLSKNLENAEKLRALAQPEIFFNYTGRSEWAPSTSLLFQPARESVGPTGVHKNISHFRLLLEGTVVENQLCMAWIYSKNSYRRTTVEKLAQSFMVALRAIIDEFAT
jgi:non-ribosomal peptide synthase protein (TIGR01720 family)